MDRIQTVTDAVNWFRVDATVWNLWLAQVGDPQDDLRLLAALPKNAVTGACGVAAQHGAFTALHATQVGLVWRLAKMVMSQRAGLQPQERGWGSVGKFKQYNSYGNYGTKFHGGIRREGESFEDGDVGGPGG